MRRLLKFDEHDDQDGSDQSPVKRDERLGHGGFRPRSEARLQVLDVH